MPPRMTIPTQLVLGALLADPGRELYGIEIGDAAGLPSGTVHPILARLEGLGWVSSRWEDVDPRAAGRPARRYHRLTGEGVAAARAALARAHRPRAALRPPDGRGGTGRVAVPGGEVEYLDVPGDPARAPLLFLHEGLGSVGLWRGWPERIAVASGRRAVAYSRLGHGSSDPPAAPRGAGFMHEEAATVVPALREALGLADPVLVGHSDGGSIALVHAATHAVAGLVVLAPHVVAEEAGLVGVAAARDAFATGGLAERMARHHRDAAVTFRNWNDVWLSEEFRSWDLRPLLPGITAPTLAIQGTDDPYGTTLHVEAVRELASGPVELLVLDCGHAPHLERPEEVAAAVLAHLERVP